MPKKTIEAARDTESEILVQVKGNQETLQKKLVEWTRQQKEVDKHVSTDIGKRNKIEKRTARTWSFPKELFDSKLPWSMCKTVIEVRRYVDEFHTKKNAWELRNETGIYICMRTVNAKQAGHMIRQHWDIENRDHYVRDVTLKEDASRIRRSPSIFARLRSWALNILRFNNETNISCALYSNALDFNRLLNYKALL